MLKNLRLFLFCVDLVKKPSAVNNKHICKGNYQYLSNQHLGILNQITYWCHKKDMFASPNEHLKICYH